MKVDTLIRYVARIDREPSLRFGLRREGAVVAMQDRLVVSGLGGGAGGVARQGEAVGNPTVTQGVDRPLLDPSGGARGNDEISLCGDR